MHTHTYRDTDFALDLLEDKMRGKYLVFFFFWIDELRHACRYTCGDHHFVFEMFER